MSALPPPWPPWPPWYWYTTLPFHFPPVLVWKVFYYFIEDRFYLVLLCQLYFGFVTDLVLQQRLSALSSLIIALFVSGSVDTLLLLISLSVSFPFCYIWTALSFIVFSFRFQHRLFSLSVDCVLSLPVAFSWRQNITPIVKYSLVVDCASIMTCRLLLGLS